MTRPGSGPVCVLSHERSGTHLAIDAIRNNFPSYLRRGYCSLKYLALHEAEAVAQAESVQTEAVVVKAHAPNGSGECYAPSKIVGRLFESLVAQGDLIYVIRDPREVLSSYFEHLKAFGELDAATDFAAFLRERRRLQLTPGAYWLAHARHWVAAGAFVLSFGDLYRDYERTLARLGDQIPVERSDRLVDVRDLPGAETSDVALTAVRYRARSRQELLSLYQPADLEFLCAETESFGAQFREVVGVGWWDESV